MDAAPLTPFEEKTKIISSMLMAFAESEAQGVVEQYFGKLVAILTDLRAAGYDTRKLEDIFITTLRDKEKGGYINYACELAAASYFKKNFPDEFMYQVENIAPATPSGTGPSKNFDFSFVADGHVFNVEVKTFGQQSPDNDAPPIKVFLPRPAMKGLYGLGMRFSRNCIPTIGRFLEDANTQLVRPTRGLSVILVALATSSARN